MQQVTCKKCAISIWKKMTIFLDETRREWDKIETILVKVEIFPKISSRLVKLWSEAKKMMLKVRGSVKNITKFSADKSTKLFWQMEFPQQQIKNNLYARVFLSKLITYTEYKNRWKMTKMIKKFSSCRIYRAWMLSRHPVIPRTQSLLTFRLFNAAFVGLSDVAPCSQFLKNGPTFFFRNM